ncbi:ras-related protein Rab-30 [Asbolus verrucosus]|uniref:Ras-related protein Rab-30 n=1 Tax=Asbolus verrucosus TaxID=1661398 RepID=A0A482VFB5_ASBVE|nr:ras-related protein Rab-30 [Asbolus verrucosus]
MNLVFDVHEGNPYAAQAHLYDVIYFRCNQNVELFLQQEQTDQCQLIMDDYKFLFKVVLVGNAGVGKTCLVRRFTQGLFPPGQGATIGVDFMIKTVDVDNEKVKLQIWDTAGQERFRSITQSYYRSAHALILVYDISCQPTFDCLPDWLREIEEYASSKVLRILVGNKIDREDREIPTHVGEEFAERHNMYFLETSAKEAENVERLFMQIAEDLMKVGHVHYYQQL